MKESIVRSLEGLHEQRTLELVKIAIRKGFGPLQILEWLKIGMDRVGGHYEKSDYFIADLIFAGIIFQGVMELPEFKALYAVSKNENLGTILAASVKGDCHDIGKRIFVSFATAEGFIVEDIGVDVPPQVIAQKAIKLKPDIIALSGMLHPVIAEMKNTVDELVNLGIRDDFKILIGGTCIESGETHKLVGADYATNNVAKGVKLCEQWMREKRK